MVKVIVYGQTDKDNGWCEEKGFDPHSQQAMVRHDCIVIL